jgi:N-acetylmuramic acid 6-phosphate etherase
MRITESPSHYDNIEHKSTLEILTDINNEDQKVALAVQAVLPQIESLVDAIYHKMKDGGRLFYIGAGTSGRLGVLDASECPPTYGVPQGLVIGLIAGGDMALRFPIEKAEDHPDQAWLDLAEHEISERDVLVGIAASGTTPYVINGLRTAQQKGIVTGSISCNPDAPLSKVADHPIEVVVGPEYITGSTRMKSGTAQKLILNMITTSVMVKLGRVQGNRMVDMQLSNDKLLDRGTLMVVEKTGLNYEEAQQLLLQHGSVRKAVDAIKN